MARPRKVYSSRGFATIYERGARQNYNLAEREGGHFLEKWHPTKSGRGGITESIKVAPRRNWMQAELNAKDIFRGRVAESQRKGKFKSSYSSMWFEPNVKYVGKSWALK